MRTSNLKVPKITDNDHSTNLFGGCVAQWASELETLNEVEIKTEQLGLSCKKLALLSAASNELLVDSSPSFESVLTGFTKEHLFFVLLGQVGSESPRVVRS